MSFIYFREDVAQLVRVLDSAQKIGLKLPALLRGVNRVKHALIA